MAKKAGRPRTSTGQGPPVRIEPDLKSMLEYIAARRGVPLSKYVSDLIRQVVEKEFADAVPKFENKFSDAKDSEAFDLLNPSNPLPRDAE
jgi:hypothetical protein